MLIECSPKSFPMLAIEIYKDYGKLVIEAPTESDASDLYNALRSFELTVSLFSPAFLLLERGVIQSDLQTVFADVISGKSHILITTPLSRRFKLPSGSALNTITVNVCDQIHITELVRQLTNMGYKKTSIIEDSGYFSVKGDIVDVAMDNGESGIRVEFFDNEIEKIHRFSLSTQRNIETVESATIYPMIFNRNFMKDWREKVEKELKGKGNREIMEVEEMIEDGVGELYDLFPLITGSNTIEDYLQGSTTLIWEKVKGEIYYEQRFEKIANERSKKITNGSFSPFNVSSYFKEELNSGEIFVSDLISKGKKIKKQISSSIRMNELERKTPEMFLKKVMHKGDKSVVLFVGSKVDHFRTVAKKNSIEFAVVSKVPVYLDTILYIVETSFWITEDIALSFSEQNAIFLSSSLFPLYGVGDEKRDNVVSDDVKNYPPLNLQKMNIAEYVVHYNYGIATFEGIKRISNVDCLTLKYEKDDMVYLPVYNMHLCYKYRWEEGYFPKLSNLRTGNWEKIKKKVDNEIEKVAEGIIQLYAERAVETGVEMNCDNDLVREFTASFPYLETPDQAKSISEIFTDMQSGKVMDRLLCGDVGFGKTEVAMRACMAAVASGMQAAILVPTTVLAAQHFQVLKERFKEFPVKIEMLSRFYSDSKQRSVIKELESGVADVVVGTHRLLSKDIKYKSLGILIVDEEHRFGVGQKERIKEIRKGIDSLSMTATPIPRTLQMSILGLRDVSFIKTPPKERKRTRTYVLEFSEEIIKEAIIKEMDRDGQIYFVHNRIISIPEMKKLLEDLVPGIKVATAHGRMDEIELENVMTKFANKEYNILVATTLIESGIDIPRVNTIIINRSDMFGLAQLYQLRGRVGRSNREAFAYLMVPSLKSVSNDAYSRLAAIKRFDKLGAGYDVAMEDLNIRGGGNILGLSQSGKLKGVGYDLYLELLKERISSLKNESFEYDNIEIKSMISSFIPEDYIEDPEVRLSFYRKLSSMNRSEELQMLTSLFTEMYGDIPKELQNLLEITSLKIKAGQCGVAKLELDENYIVLHFPPSAIPEDVSGLFAVVDKFKGRFVAERSINIPVVDGIEYETIVQGFLDVFHG